MQRWKCLSARSQYAGKGIATPSRKTSMLGIEPGQFRRVRKTFFRVPGQRLEPFSQHSALPRPARVADTVELFQQGFQVRHLQDGPPGPEGPAAGRGARWRAPSRAGSDGPLAGRWHGRLGGRPCARPMPRLSSLAWSRPGCRAAGRLRRRLIHQAAAVPSQSTPSPRLSQRQRSLSGAVAWSATGPDGSAGNSGVPPAWPGGVVAAATPPALGRTNRVRAGNSTSRCRLRVVSHQYRWSAGI